MLYQFIPSQWLMEKKKPEETKNIQNAEAWTFLKKDDFRCAISKTFTK